MGRKGGGKRGFMKATRRVPGDAGSDDEEASTVPAETQEHTEPEAGEAHPAAASFLQDNGGAAEQTGGEASVSSPGADQQVSVDAGRTDNEKGGETRGQMLQRHKRVCPAAQLGAAAVVICALSAFWPACVFATQPAHAGIQPSLTGSTQAQARSALLQ